MIVSASTSPMRVFSSGVNPGRAGAVDFVSDDVGFAIGAEQQIDVIVLAQRADEDRREPFDAVRQGVLLARLQRGRLDGSRRPGFRCSSDRPHDTR